MLVCQHPPICFAPLDAHLLNMSVYTVCVLWVKKDDLIDDSGFELGLARGLQQFVQALLSAIGRGQFEHRSRGLRCATEQRAFHGAQIGAVTGLGRQDLTKVVVDRRGIVDQQYAPVYGVAYGSPSATIRGTCRMNCAPFPGPSL